MITEKDNLQAIKNRMLKDLQAVERKAARLREALKANDIMLNYAEEGLDGLSSESEKEKPAPADEGPTGRELVLDAIREYRLTNPSSTFKGADLSKIIRRKGGWTKKTPLSAMVFMTLKRLVETQEVEAVDEGTYNVKQGSGSTSPSQVANG